MAVLLLVQLLIVLLWKYRSREGGKASTDSIPFTVTSEAYTPVQAQLTEVFCNEAYQTIATAISTEPHTAHEENAAYDGRVDNKDDYDELDYQTTATAHPTEHIESHGNEAYQTTATAISTQPNATDGGQVDYDDQNDFEVNAAYGGLVNDWEVNAGLVDDQNVYEEIAANGGRVDNQDDEEYAEPRYQTTATADPTEHMGTHGNEAYQTIAISISTLPNTTDGGQVDNPNDYEENAAYGGQVDDQFDCKENAVYGSRVGNQDDIRRRLRCT